MANICVQAFVSGKVQGVWYRQSTKQEALRYGLTGWANNLADGRVEVMLCGEADAVAQVQSWLLIGSDDAQVINVVAERVDCQPIAGFVTG